MAKIVDHIDFQTLLQTSVAPRKTFGIQLFLVDDDQIPIDQRLAYTTPTGYDDEYTESSEPYKYADVYFGQALKADQLMFGRWISSASNPYFIAGSGYEKDFAVWELVTDAEWGVLRGSGPGTQLNYGPVDFDGITALEQVLPIMNAAMAGDSIVASFGSLGRLIFTDNSASGAAADTIVVNANAAPTGTEISETLIDASNGSAVAGLDAETLSEAAIAVSALDDSYYNIHVERGASDTQKEAFANWVENQEKLCDLVTDDTDCLATGNTDNLAYNLYNINLKRTLVIWHRDAGNAYPDAAAAGRFLPEKEGTFQFEWQDLAKITDSGIGDGTGAALTTTERNNLKLINCSHIERIAPITFLYNGLTAGGIEKRIMLGRDWFVARNREDIFTFQVQSKLATFDNETLTAIEEIIRKNGNEATDRRIIVNTPERPFTVTLPDADDIDQATRATHELVVFDAFQAWLNVAIHDYKIVGTWTL